MRGFIVGLALWLSFFAVSRYVHAASEQEKAWRVAEEDGGEYREPDEASGDPIAPPAPMDPEPSDEPPVDNSPPPED